MVKHDANDSQRTPGDFLPEPFPPLPEALAGSQISDRLEGAKLKALSGGEVIVGPFQHDSGCGAKETGLYKFLGRTQGHFSIQNLGDCPVEIKADGKRLLVIGGHSGGGAEFNATTLTFRCLKGGRRCKFLWVIRKP